MTGRKEFDRVVPLHLIPITIAQRIREKGGNLYRISVIRTEGHHYTIKCKCRSKIAMEPLEDGTSHATAPGPAPLSGSPGTMQGPGQFTAPFSRNQTDRIMSRALELVADFSKRNPEPEPLSGEPGTVVMAIDQANGSKSQRSELITGSSGTDPGPESLSGQPGMAGDNG
jgi:hypothetical protein